MSTQTTRWTRDALLARLDAAKAIDSDTGSTARERAESRMELLRVASAVDEGRIDALEAEVAFRRIVHRLQPLTLSA